MAASLAVCEIFSVTEWRDLENWLKDCSRSLKWHRSIDHVRLFIGRPLYSSILHHCRVIWCLNRPNIYRDLEIWVSGHSYKVIKTGTIRFGTVSCSPSTQCSKKVSHLMFDNNVGKRGPIFKIFSPGDS